MTLVAGDLLDGRYRLMEPIGVGGTSTVYRAHDEQLGRNVAIKRFAEGVNELTDDGRRRSEVRLLAGLAHPGIVTLFDAALDSKPPYLVMELVEGESLRDRLKAGPLSPRDADEIGAAVAAGLAAIHERGVVHRDVKPDNILLPHNSSILAARLVDFGIARPVASDTVTAVGQIVGTAAYLSPEQARGDVAGPPSDVYSLGLVLIEALTGSRPFPGSTLESMAARLANDPDLSAPELEGHRDLLAAMTQRDPAVRPGVGEVAARLRGLATTRVLPSATTAATVPLAPVPAVGAPAAAPAPKPGRRRVLAAVIGGLIITLGVLAAATAGLTGDSALLGSNDESAPLEKVKVPPAPPPPADEEKDEDEKKDEEKDQGKDEDSGGGNGNQGGGNGGEGNGPQGRDG